MLASIIVSTASNPLGRPVTLAETDPPPIEYVIGLIEAPWSTVCTSLFEVNWISESG